MLVKLFDGELEAGLVLKSVGGGMIEVDCILLGILDVSEIVLGGSDCILSILLSVSGVRLLAESDLLLCRGVSVLLEILSGVRLCPVASHSIMSFS